MDQEIKPLRSQLVPTADHGETTRIMKGVVDRLDNLRQTTDNQQMTDNAVQVTTHRRRQLFGPMPTGFAGLMPLRRFLTSASASPGSIFCSKSEFAAGEEDKETNTASVVRKV
jgi:uncharacterized UPF0160 family protein